MNANMQTKRDNEAPALPTEVFLRHAELALQDCFDADIFTVGNTIYMHFTTGEVFTLTAERH